MSGVPLLVSAEEVRSHLTLELCIPAVREAMIALSAGRTIQPLRSVVRMGEGRLFGAMPGAMGERDMFGAKLVSVFEDPLHPGRHRHRGLVVLFEPESGEPVCIADAEALTLVRTAAASAVATEVLSRPESSSLGLFGTGAQAEIHARAIARVRPIDLILVCGRSAERAAGLAARLGGELGVEARAAGPEEAARADILCTVTAASEPVLRGAWVGPGTHVNAVGSSVAGPVEVDQALVVASRYVVDSRVSALAQAAEFLAACEAGEIGDDHIVAEIGEVLAGARSGRRSPDEITFYKSLGHVVQDLAAARLLYRLRAPTGGTSGQGGEG